MTRKRNYINRRHRRAATIIQWSSERAAGRFKKFGFEPTEV